MKPFLAKFLLLSFLFHTQASWAEPGVSDSEIVIGQSISTAARSKEMIEGQKTYFDKVNAQGGVNGRKVRVVAYDDGFDPARALENTKKLLHEDHAFALFQYYGTPVIKSVLPIVASEDVPLIAPSSGGEFLRTPVLKNVFNVKPGFFMEARELVRFLTSGCGAKKIALLYQDDAFGLDGRNGIQKELNGMGLSLAASGTYKRGTSDIDAAYAEISKAKPDAVILWAVGKPAGAFIKKAAADSAFSPVFAGSLIVASKEFEAEVGKGGEKVFLTQSVPINDPSVPMTGQYLKDTRAAHFTPDPAGMEGYLSAAVLVEALKRAGKTPTRQSLRDTLESFKGVDFGGIQVSFSPTSHQGISKVFLTQYKEGKYFPVSAGQNRCGK